MDNSINFKGVFYFEKPTNVVKNGLEKIFIVDGKKIKHTQIIHDIFNKGDIAYVTGSRNTENRIIDFLLHKDLKRSGLKYYPELSTHSGFDDELPSEAKKIIQAQGDNFVSTKEKLKGLYEYKLPKIITTKKSNNDMKLNIKALELDGKDNVISFSAKTGSTTIKDSQGEQLATISPIGDYGVYYAKKRQKEPNGAITTLYYAIQDGQTFQYKTLDGIKKFNENYAKAVKLYLAEAAEK